MGNTENIKIIDFDSSLYLKNSESLGTNLQSYGEMLFTAKDLEQAYNDGTKDNEDRCGSFDIEKYKK